MASAPFSAAVFGRRGWQMILAAVLLGFLSLGATPAAASTLVAPSSPDACALSGLALGAFAACDGAAAAAAAAAAAQKSLNDRVRVIAALGLLGMMAMWGALLVKFYVSVTRSMARGAALRAEWPRFKGAQAEVVMCLRGGDAALELLFSALAAQTHRAWHLRVVVDSEADPAMAIATKAIAAAAPTASWRSATVEPLRDRHPATGSLKCAALRQAYTSLHPDTEVVVGVDGDAAIQPDWLITLIAEVKQPGVGAASGNRWFEPSSLAPIDFVRALWGTAGAAVMEALTVPWGGSLAVRREVVEAGGWLEALKTSFCEDTALTRHLWAGGWRFVWVPAIVSIDADSPGKFVPVSRWIARQLLCAHMHHPLFWATLIPFGIVGGALPTAILAAAAGAAVAGNYELARTLLGALVLKQLSLVGLVSGARAVLMHNVIKPLGLQAQLRPRSDLRWYAGTLAWIYACQLVNMVGCVWCLYTRHVEWRGVHYERTGHQHVHIARRDDGEPVAGVKQQQQQQPPQAKAQAKKQQQQKAVAVAAVKKAAAAARPTIVVEACSEESPRRFLWAAYAPSPVRCALEALAVSAVPGPRGGADGAKAKAA